MRSTLHRLLLARPYKPRNPIMRAVFSLLGLLFLFGVCILAIFIGLFMLVSSVLLKRVGKLGRAETSGKVIDAEYAVVQPHQAGLTR